MEEVGEAGGEVGEAGGEVGEGGEGGEVGEAGGEVEEEAGPEAGETETEEGGGGESNEGQAAYSPSVWSERAGKTSSVAGGRRREVGVGGDQCAPMMLRPARRKR